MARSEFAANQALASTIRATTADAYGASAYDRIGRNAMAYRPSLYNARTAKRGAFSRIVSAIVNALF